MSLSARDDNGLAKVSISLINRPAATCIQQVLGALLRLREFSIRSSRRTCGSKMKRAYLRSWRRLQIFADTTRVGKA